MRRRSLLLPALFSALILASFAVPAGAGPDDRQPSDGDTVVDTKEEVYSEEHGSSQQHGGATGHLPASSSNVRLVGKAAIHDQRPGRVADLAALGNFAYVGLHSAGLPEPQCTGGIDVFDISAPANPRRVNFLPSAQNTYATEGVQALSVSTPSFTGDLLVVSNEDCGTGGLGGLTLWDVTDPRKAVKLSEGFGDFTNGHFKDRDSTVDPIAHAAHSAFAWQDENRVYAIMIDNEELLDLDFMDITDPTNPVLIAETAIEDWNKISPGTAFGDFPTSHDFDVRNIGGDWFGMISYWDAGWVLLNLNDPSRPRFIRDYDYPACDQVFNNICPPEGNAHQGEWNLAGDLFLGTDEDQSAYRFERFEVTSGPLAGRPYPAGEFSWTVPIAELPDRQLNGPTIFGGYGCPGDRGSIPPASTLGPLDEGEEAIIVFERGPVSDPNQTQEACFFSEKVESGQLAGYTGVIVANHHVGAGAGDQPDGFLCGGQGHAFTPTVPGVCIGHRAMHELFGRTPDYTVPYPVGDPGDVEPNVGDSGPDVAGIVMFDGWGYVRLLDADTLQEIDQLSLPEQKDPSLATGGIDLSVHEVATENEPGKANLAYFSWYTAGFRVAKFSNTGITEVGHFIDKGGNDFWGVQLGPLGSRGRRFVLASDRDFGLYIFRYTGP